MNQKVDSDALGLVGIKNRILNLLRKKRLGKQKTQANAWLIFDVLMAQFRNSEHLISDDINLVSSE